MGLPRGPHDRQRADRVGNRDCWIAGASLATDHRWHAPRPPGVNRLRDFGWGLVFLGAGIYFLSSLQSDCGCIRLRRLADDAGRRREWDCRDGDRAIPENALDHIRAERHCLSCCFWIVDWLLGLYLPAGACSYAEGRYLCIRQSDCGGLSWLDHFARARRCIYVVGDSYHYCVGGAGEYFKAEARSSRYPSKRRNLSQDCECGGRLIIGSFDDWIS